MSIYYCKEANQFPVKQTTLLGIKISEPDTSDRPDPVHFSPACSIRACATKFPRNGTVVTPELPNGGRKILR